MGSAGYSTEVQEFSNGDTTHLGTLRLPEGAGWYPAVVMVGEAAEELALFLLGLGYAVLTFEAGDADLAQMALAAADSLLMRPDIRPELIGLLGFGAGAWAAAFAAARAPETAFAVLIPGEPAPPVVELHHLADLHCPVLAFIQDEATAVTLTEHLAHNPDAIIQRSPEANNALLATLEAWLMRQRA